MGEDERLHISKHVNEILFNVLVCLCPQIFATSVNSQV